MNYAVEWNEAHKARLLIGRAPDFRLIAEAQYWLKGRDEEQRHAVSCLEVGCGTARNTEYLSAQGFSTCGFDSSPTAISRALYRLTAKSIHNFPRLIVADCTKPWPYTPRSFYLVVDIRSLENLTEEELTYAWAQAARVLCSGGRFLSVCASPLRDDKLTTAGKVLKLKQDQIEGLIARNGFSAEVEQHSVQENGKVVEDWLIIATKN
jgi:SAM-dependent methyltransferase